MRPASTAPDAWSDALLAAALFAVDPAGLGGVALRSAPGPARDAWTQSLLALLAPGAPVRRVPVGTQDDRLLGGLDLASSLAAGRPMVDPGVLAGCDCGLAILSMAERLEDGTGARLAAVMDSGEVRLERDGLSLRLPARVGFVLLDEGIEADERPPDALLERMGFQITLDDIGRWERRPGRWSADAAQAGRARLTAVQPPLDDLLEALCLAAEALGLTSSRPAILALRAACAHAALMGRTVVEAADAAVAVRLVLAPRVGQSLEAASASFPERSEDPASETPSEPTQDSLLEPTLGTPPEQRPQNAAGAGDVSLDAPRAEAPAQDAETMIAAVQAVLPAGLFEQVKHDGARSLKRATRQGSGASLASARRGRPLGSRPGALRGGDRLDLPQTLRAASPWQRLRAAVGAGPRIRVRREDLRIRRFSQRREATTIFLVDASGSAAFQRLAEAKGAVELLLAKAYVSRARVALVAFRSLGAEVLLEPTRSLTRAKRSLAELPGGGGTPLAAGLDAALALAQAESLRGRTPMIVILTDGRANIGRGGAPGRPQAEADALAASRSVREAGVRAVFIDTSPRAQPDGDRFARAMAAVYAPLPYLEAAAVSNLVAGLRPSRG